MGDSCQLGRLCSECGAATERKKHLRTLNRSEPETYRRLHRAAAKTMLLSDVGESKRMFFFVRPTCKHDLEMGRTCFTQCAAWQGWCPPDGMTAIFVRSPPSHQLAGRFVPVAYESVERLANYFDPLYRDATGGTILQVQDIVARGRRFSRGIVNSAKNKSEHVRALRAAAENSGGGSMSCHSDLSRLALNHHADGTVCSRLRTTEAQSNFP